jgi:hypothetical protein
MALVTCDALNTALDDKQDKLTNCAGAPLAGSVPTCAEMTAAIAASTIPDATSVLKGKVELATVAECIAGTDSVRAVTPEGLQAAIAAGVTAAIAGMADVFAL